MVSDIYQQKRFYVALNHLSDPVYIQTKSTKILWVIVVCAGFIGAGLLIGKSYKEWQEKPISTSITTHPIDHLDFPVVTVCPPKNTNYRLQGTPTALYHDLVKAGNESLSEKDRNTLKGAAYELFIKKPPMEHVKMMLPTLKMGNMDQVLQGFHSLPNPANGFEVKMWNLNGTISTPWFGEDFVEDYFKEDREFHIVLEFPEDIKEQIGSGSLIIELEVNTRAETGWIENIFVYTYHTTEKNWTGAEAECQREGSHLASVTSEEVNRVVNRVAGDKGHWLGARRESGKWRWSDNSSWGFTKWQDGEQDHGDGSCVNSDGGWWYHVACEAKYPFICQREKALMGKSTLNLAYTKDQLNISSFHLWYNFKTASRQLLDSWKDQRMTGFRFSWRIENPTEIWTSSIGEVGRSIQTPRLGEPFSSSETKELLYKVVLTIAEDFQHQIGNETLIVELDVDMRKGDEIACYSSYKLHRKPKTWAKADAQCKSEGGQLASIHSNDQQRLAEEASYQNVWLGGRRKENDHWSWSDNSTWDFTNWKMADDEDNGDGCLSMSMYVTVRGKWSAKNCGSAQYFLCHKEITVTRRKGLTRLYLEKKFFPLHVTFKGKKMTETSDEEKGRSGFTLNWFLKDKNGNQLTERLPPRQEDWKQEAQTPKYEQPLLAEMVQLARKLRLQNMTKKEIMEEVIHNKLKNMETLEGYGMCSTGRVDPNRQNFVFSLVAPHVNTDRTDGPPLSDDDIETGFELFHAIDSCPPATVFKLFRFIDQLLSSESSRTIIQTMVNTFHSGSIADETSFTLAKQFYFVLASTLNLTYGDVLLATSTNAQMEAMIGNGLPFFANNTDLVAKCLQGFDCDGIEGILQKLGMFCCWC